MARAVLCVVLCAVYCILVSVLLMVPPLKSPSLPISRLPTLLTCSSLSLRCSLPPPLASFLPSLPLPPFLTSSIPHSLPLSLPPILHPSSLLPCLPPVQCTPYVCLASCTLLCSANHAWHWGNGDFAPEEGVVSMACCYVQRTCPHHESVFDKD